MLFAIKIIPFGGGLLVAITFGGVLLFATKNIPSGGVLLFAIKNIPSGGVPLFAIKKVYRSAHE